MAYNEIAKVQVASEMPGAKVVGLEDKLSDIKLLEKEPEKVRGRQFDLVLNGNEIGVGYFEDTIINSKMEEKQPYAFSMVVSAIGDRVQVPPDVIGLSIIIGSFKDLCAIL